MRPRVLTLFPSAVGGGAERLVFEQMRFHDGGRYDYAAIALRKGKLHQQFAAFPCYSSMKAGLRFSPFVLRRIHRLIQARGIELLHTHLQEADFYGFWLKRLNPRLHWISTRHNTDAFRTRAFWRAINASISRRTERVIAVSDAVRDFVAAHERIPPAKLVVVRNGIDLSRFAERPSRDEARATLALPSGDFVVGIVGRLSPQKGHHYLFEAAATLVSEIPNLRLLVVGEGQLKGRLERLARALGIAERVSFVGFRPDMGTLYATMDLLAMPSLFEGLPLVLVEALVCERVAVGARAPGITDVIEDGKNGLLVKVGDVDELAAAIARVFRGDYDREMPKRAQRAATAEYDIKAYLGRLEALYLETCGQVSLPSSDP
ncbi:MAG TPA: glycosyltransferase [Polyangia bacterium]|jgi:glycosyltransferase involved in cell wall biosynthesis|nr:glycosyltransferase [Polyangia bacterium]